MYVIGIYIVCVGQYIPLESNIDCTKYLGRPLFGNEELVLFQIFFCCVISLYTDLLFLPFHSHYHITWNSQDSRYLFLFKAHCIFD
jgi:hypothetical protein